MTLSTIEDPHHARMSFYDEDDTLLGVVCATQVPRVGDVVAPPGSTGCWMVRAVQWSVWPESGSVDRLQGRTGPDGRSDLLAQPRGPSMSRATRGAPERPTLDLNDG